MRTTEQEPGGGGVVRGLLQTAPRPAAQVGIFFLPRTARGSRLDGCFRFAWAR